MGFDRFVGNPQAVASLRRMLAAGRLPHSMVLAGPSGVGKHTLASMAARALNCLDAEAQAAGDFCGWCEPCRRIAPAEAPEQDEEFAKILATRPKMRAEDRRDHPLIFSSHPDVMVFLPDGPLKQISIDQARRLKELAQFVPSAARRRVFIVDEADRMDPPAANSMLKVLEEPPPGAVVLLTATNYYELLPTIRSRCIALHLGPAPAEEVEKFLATRRDLPAADLRLAAHLAEGSPGRALKWDLESARELRGQVLHWLELAAAPKPKLEELMDRTEALARGPESLEAILGVLYGLLEDLIHLAAGRPVLRNLDLEDALRRLARSVGWSWMAATAERLDLLGELLRRNVNKQIALEALGAALAPIHP